MNVPFERLNDFLSQLTHKDTIIYQFSPPGSRKITDIENVDTKYNKIHSWYDLQHCIPMLIHDQEPLNFQLYESHDLEDLCSFFRQRSPSLERHGLTELKARSCQGMNLQIIAHWMPSVCDAMLMTHSETCSTDVDRYESIGVFGVYWWSHAMIARDWFRFAPHDQSLLTNSDFRYDFNIYNRAWTGTREYRLKFVELVKQSQLEQASKIGFAPWCDQQHYTDHQYVNPRFRITTNLESLPPNTAPSTASADYSSQDYSDCAIDVVLETLFDATKIHLTEKTLRPIACGKPFILASTPGSLAYLRSYGFKTFDSVIDESYDAEMDPVIRLEKITALMQQICNLNPADKNRLYQQLHAIAQHNKQRFWSEEFGQHLVSEFKQNYLAAWARAQNCMTGQRWLKNRRTYSAWSQEFKQQYVLPQSPAHRTDLVKLLQRLRRP